MLPRGVRDSCKQYWAKAHLTPDLNKNIKKVGLLMLTG
jgi:hypothetical protein